MKIIVAISLVLLFASCRKEIEYVGEGKSPVLVLDGILENHVSMEIKLTRSIFFLSNSQNENDVAIEDAVATIYDVTNGVSYNLAHTSNGRYYNAALVLPNTKYRIEISHPKYPTISSEMTTVSDPIIQDIDTSVIEFSNGFYSSFYHLVKIKFNDEPAVENFYSADVFLRTQNMHFDEDSILLFIDTNNISSSVFSEDVSFDFVALGGAFFTDVLFNGAQKIFQLNAYPNFNYEPFVEKKVIGYNALLNNISKDTYKYLKSRGQNNPGDDPFVDPSNVHSNVTNGLGIFGSFSRVYFEK